MRWLRDYALGLVAGLVLLLIQAYAGTDLITASWRALAVTLAIGVGATYLERRQHHGSDSSSATVDRGGNGSANLSFSGGLRRLLIPGPKSRIDPTQVRTPATAPETVPVATDQKEALVVTWVGERMWNFHHKAWIFLLRYRVENRTEQPIDVIHINFQGPPMALTTPEIYQERQRVESELGVPPKTVPQKGTVDRWYLGEFAWNPELGEPGYEIRLKASNGGHEYGFRRLANPKRETAPPSPLGSLPAGQLDRVVVRRTLAEIFQLFDGLTDAQAQKLVDPYVGKWLEVSGPVGDVHISGDSGLLSLHYEGEHHYHSVSLSFDAQRWGDQLSMLRPEERVRVIGRIKGVSRVTIVMEDCELLGPPGMGYP